MDYNGGKLSRLCKLIMSAYMLRFCSNRRIKMKTISEDLAQEILALLNVGIHDTPARHCMRFVRARNAFAAECDKPAESREAVLSASLKTAMTEIDALKAALAKFNAPRCPAGMIEHHTKIDGVELVFHMEYLPAEKPDYTIGYRTNASMTPVSWFHKGDDITDVFDIDERNNSRICNEALAAYEDFK